MPLLPMRSCCSWERPAASSLWPSCSLSLPWALWPPFPEFNTASTDNGFHYVPNTSYIYIYFFFPEPSGAGGVVVYGVVRYPHPCAPLKAAALFFLGWRRFYTFLFLCSHIPSGALCPDWVVLAFVFVLRACGSTTYCCTEKKCTSECRRGAAREKMT